MLAYSGWLRLQPLGMTGLAKELGLVVAPSFHSALGMSRHGIATRTLEELVFGLAFGQQLGHKAKKENSRDDNAKNCFRRHEAPLMPNA